MEEARQEKLKISNDLLDAMLVGGKTQDDLWGNEGIITQINKALLERILNAEWIITPTKDAPLATQETDTVRKLSRATSDNLNCPLHQIGHAR